METLCRFPSCGWTCDVNDIFEHCETHHKQFIKEINDSNGFAFTFNDIQKETFLLNGHNGLYWFLLDPNEDESCIRRGIFAIGESEIVKYTAKIGKSKHGYCAYIGPLETKPDTSKEYELEWSYIHLDFLNDEYINKSMEIYFGDYEDKEEYNGTFEDVDWDDPEEEVYNRLCLEKFTCFICYEYIKSHARFCENQHFLCLICLEKLIEMKKYKCPMCQADYEYDCSDEEIENLLKCVKFPDTQP